MCSCKGFLLKYSLHVRKFFKFTIQLTPLLFALHRAVAKKNLQYPTTNPLFVIPAEAGTQGSVNEEKGRKPGKMGIKPTTSRLWVPASAGMTENGLSQ
jgi:hypothetical protein